MASTQESQIVSASDASMDSSPLLASSAEPINASDTAERPSLTRRGRISRVFNLMRRQSGRRLMSEPSVLVRETAAEQLEERQSEWAYSRPVVILDLIWNLVFVIVASVVLLISTQERPSNPLRIWVLGYAAQCCIHMACVWVEYRRRRSNGSGRYGIGTPSYTSNEADLPFSERYRVNQDADQSFEDAMASQLSTAKRVESANTSFSFVWWVLGFYWTTTGNQSQNAPLLFWLCAAFLAFDVFFVVFCVSLACIIGIAVCCCLPCIIALMYVVAEQEGASEEDINMLPKYKFRCTGSFAKAGMDMGGPSGGVLSILSATGAAEDRELPAEDAECCICLCAYDDGVEIRELQCNHHFHCACIDRWLRMNSTCPLCKFNVLKENYSRREDA